MFIYKQRVNFKRNNRNGKIKFATLDNQGNLQIKQNDNYYFQVMGQLKITRQLFCYFIIWLPYTIL